MRNKTKMKACKT